VAGVNCRTHTDGQEAHTASCTMGTDSLSGGKWPRRGVDHPAPSSAEFECSYVAILILCYTYSYSYTSLPPRNACLTALYCNKLKTIVCSKTFFLLSLRMFQSVRRHSVVVLTVTINGM